MKIGILGQGYVGTAIKIGFEPYYTNLNTFDKFLKEKSSVKNLEELVECSDIIFVCLPTPMKKNGNQDLSFIINFFKNKKINDKPIYIIKSTVLPGTTKNLSNRYPNLKLVFSPEFLTERTAKLDILTQSRVIIGSDNKKYSNSVEKLFNSRFKNRNIIKTNSITAEYIKYMNNNFFATKVSLMNEFYRFAKKLNINWNDALNGFVSDQRIGDSHLNVPGPDGKLGFGGSCFPKDINAMINFANKKNIKMNVLEAAWKTNLEVRPEEDWKKLKGRAVS